MILCMLITGISSGPFSPCSFPPCSFPPCLRHWASLRLQQEHFDVFNALDLMDNTVFLKELLFEPGDGHLKYYFYNYRVKPIEPKELALVLQ